MAVAQRPDLFFYQIFNGNPTQNEINSGLNRFVLDRLNDPHFVIRLGYVPSDRVRETLFSRVHLADRPIAGTCSFFASIKDGRYPDHTLRALFSKINVTADVILNAASGSEARPPCILSERKMTLLLGQIDEPVPVDPLIHGLLVTAFVSCGYSSRMFKLLNQKLPEDCLSRDVGLAIKSVARKVLALLP